MAKTYIPPTEVNFVLEECSIDEALQAAGAFSDERGHNFVPADNLVILPGYNMRVHSKNYGARVKFLEEQILTHGYDLTKPIAVLPIKIDGKPCVAVHDGHHRTDGVKNANKKLTGKSKIAGIPVEFKTNINFRQLMAGLMLDNSGEPPSPLEASIVVRRLQNDGMHVKDIAKSLGSTRRWIDDLVLLSSATEVIQNAMIDGEISPTTVIDELRNYSPDDVEKRFLKAQKVVAPTGDGRRKVTAKSLGKVVAKKKVKRKSAGSTGETTPVTAVNDFIALFDELLQTAVETDGDSAIKPYMEIAYASGVGYAATILSSSRDENPEAETLAQGTGETAADACFSATKDHAERLLETAAADL
jgi:hypothetical protein